MTRNVTPPRSSEQTPDSTPESGRFRLYTLCVCDDCTGTGKVREFNPIGGDGIRGTHFVRCKTCRGEGRTLQLAATATDPESLGVAIVTLGREGEFDGDCPIGILDRPTGQTGVWLVKPWRPSARNLSDAGRALAHHRHHSDIV